MDLEGRIKRLAAPMIKAAYLCYETKLARMTTRSPMRVLFSDDAPRDWMAKILSGMSRTPHQAIFGPITETAIANHDLVVPLTMNSLRDLARKTHLVANNPIPIPTLESINICDDKSLFNHMLIEHGFGKLIPYTHGKHAYPYILKKRIDEWSRGSHLIRSPKEEAGFADLLDDPDYFRQAFIVGRHEYATHILFKSGKIQRSLNYRYTFDTYLPIKGRSGIVAESLCHCAYLDIFENILRIIGFEGLCCVNYKIANGMPMVLEINPRFGGSLSPYFFSFMRSLG